MNKTTKIVALIAVAIVAVIVAIALLVKVFGSKLDVIQTDAARAFGAVLAVLPATKNDADGYYFLAAPDESAQFYFDNQGLAMSVDALPFASAGADLSTFDNFSATDNRLTFFLPAFNMLNENPPSEPLAVFQKNLKVYRQELGYHTALDHYGIKFGDGNMFEWAKNLQTHSVTGENQDKDIVFVLNPEAFIAAGADVENIDGWVYAPVSVEENGVARDVWKLLKPFDLR
jgi:hypothetical protein